MIFKQIVFPDKDNHSIEMPEQFYGKKIEVSIVEVNSDLKSSTPLPPAGKKTTITKLLADFGANPNFPSAEEIRDKAWPSKW